MMGPGGKPDAGDRASGRLPTAEMEMTTPSLGNGTKRSLGVLLLAQPAYKLIVRQHRQHAVVDQRNSSFAATVMMTGKVRSHTLVEGSPQFFQTPVTPNTRPSPREIRFP